MAWRWRAVGLVLAGCALGLGAQGCEQILGLDKFHDAEDMTCTPGTMQSCYRGADGTEGVGICRAGTQSCKDDGSGWTECVGDVLPATVEDCTNNVDDDCNGKVNDTCSCAKGATMPCYSGDPATQGKGICHAGTATCNDDGTGYGECVGEVTPKPEDCSTTADDNCDGNVNEASAGCTCVPGETKPCYSGMTGTEGVGLCLGGMQACNDDGLGFGACTGEVTPTVEDCSNATDEDCDGFACSQTIWAKDLGIANYGYSISHMVVHKSSDSIYVAGRFYGSIQFDSTVLIDKGGGDIFVAKLDPDGTALWVKQFGTSNAITPEYPVGFDVDSMGNAFLASEGDLGNGTNVMKLDASGNTVWSKACGTGPAHLGRVVDALAADPAGDVILTGHFGGSLDCAGSTTSTTSSTDFDVLLAKLGNTNGTPAWVKKFGNSGDERGEKIATDSGGNIYLAGRFYESFSFGTPGNFVTHPGGSNADVFVTKLTPAGAAVFTHQLGDNKGAGLGGIMVDKTANTVVFGSYQGTISLSGTLTITNPSTTTYDGYIARFDGSGNGVWLKDTQQAASYGVTSDSKNDVFVGATLFGTGTFGNGMLTGMGTSGDVVVAKIDGPSGNVLWQRQFGDTAAQKVVAIATAQNDEPVVAGTFQGTLVFDATTLMTTATGSNYDTFLVKIAP
ncbi:MAG: hypothetical protein QM820_22610 [Minicystis sp.]